MRYIITAILALTLLTGAGPVADSRNGDNHSRRDCPNPLAVAEHFGTQEGEEGWNPRFDLNDDGAVTVGDIIISSNCWLALGGRINP